MEKLKAENPMRPSISHLHAQSRHTEETTIHTAVNCSFRCILGRALVYVLFRSVVVLHIQLFFPHLWSFNIVLKHFFILDKAANCSH